MLLLAYLKELTLLRPILLTSQHFSFSLPVWRILYDTLPTKETAPLLLFELRDKNQLKWGTFDCETGVMCWEHSFPETTWWTSAIGFYSGIILLHEYAGSEQPSPKKLIAIDALTGQLTWSLDGCKFEHTDGTNLQTSKMRPESAPIVENRAISTGEVVDLPFPSTQSILSQWRAPVTYEETNPYYETVAQFIEKITGNLPKKGINYGEISGHLLFFYYFYSANAVSLSWSILVVNSTKTVLLHETILSDVESSAFGDYLYDNHHIVLLKKVDEITVIKLPRP